MEDPITDDEKEQEEEEGDLLPTVSGRTLSFPEEISYPRKVKEKKRDQKYAHLGPIGYTRNIWRAADGDLKKVQNIWLGWHAKKTVMYELARRLVLAESLGGLPRDIDRDSLVSTQTGYYDKGRAPDRTKNRERYESKKGYFDIFK